MLRAWQEAYGDKVNVVLANANSCPTSYQSSVDANCASNLLFTSNSGASLVDGELHQTNIVDADGTVLLEVRDDGIGTKCGTGGLTPEKAEIHDNKVRDFLDDLVGEPADPCKTANGGCDQVCTNKRGSAVCSCNAGNTLDNSGACQPGLKVEGVTTGRCVGLFDSTSNPGTVFAGSTTCSSDNAGLFQYKKASDGQGGSLETVKGGVRSCVTARDTNFNTNVRFEPCEDPPSALQQWECLADGRIRQLGTEDRWLTPQFFQCTASETPDKCPPEEIKMKAWQCGKTFCDAFDECGEKTGGPGGGPGGQPTSGAKSYSNSAFAALFLTCLACFSFGF